MRQLLSKLGVSVTESELPADDIEGLLGRIEKELGEKEDRWQQALRRAEAALEQAGEAQVGREGGQAESRRARTALLIGALRLCVCCQSRQVRYYTDQLAALERRVELDKQALASELDNERAKRWAGRRPCQAHGTYMGRAS